MTDDYTYNIRVLIPCTNLCINLYEYNNKRQQTDDNKCRI